MDNKKLSYTSVKGNFPVKIVLNESLQNKIVNQKKVIPYHLRLNITGRCNLKCDWCSRSEVDRDLEMDYDTVVNVIARYYNLGCRAVTLSGSGETLMHKKINEILKTISAMDIHIGIISNGWFIKKIKDNLDNVTWIRMSLGDNRKPTKKYWENIKETIQVGKKVDWAFSYVLTDKPDFKLFEKVVKFANENNLTHIRLISDLSIPDNSKAIEEVKNMLKDKKVDDTLVIYQTQEGVTGHPQCVVGLLRPVVDTDGTIYPCCNTQFALDTGKTSWIKDMSLGTIKDIERIYQDQIKVDGLYCQKCFSDHYNKFLHILLSDINHKRFV